MRPENKNNGDRLDKLLKDALKQYNQPVPIDFPQRMLSRLEQFERQKTIREVVWQERLLKAAFVLLPIAGVILALMFPNLLLAMSQLYEGIILLVQQTMNNIVQQWQLWTIYAAVAAVVMYAVYEVLLADN